MGKRKHVAISLTLHERLKEESKLTYQSIRAIVDAATDDWIKNFVLQTKVRDAVWTGEEGNVSYNNT